MNGFFQPDGKVFAVLSKFTDCMLLTILWLVFSAPVVTLGASMSAAYYTVDKVICNDRGTLWRTFWSSFKENFMQATCACLLFFGIAFILIVDCLYMNAVAQELTVVFLILLAADLSWAIYSFFYIARFRCSLKGILKNSLAMCILNLPWTLMILALSVVFPVLLLTCSANLLIVLVLPFAFLFATGYILERVFRKYSGNGGKSDTSSKL